MLPFVKLLALCVDIAAATNAFGPVIAVLAEPLKRRAPGSYIEAWYVKWLEAHGARVVPLRYDTPQDERNQLLARVNGVLFPGGGAGIREQTAYGRFSAEVWQTAVRERMPLWGTCLGFEQAMLYSSDEDFPGPVSRGWDAELLFAPLNLTAYGKENATLLAGWPEQLKRDSAQKPLTWHKHQAGVSIEDFANRPRLQNFWHLLATNADRQGKEFVSLVQARDGLPFFASQFHPEKNANEFEDDGESSINATLPAHSAVAIDAMSRLAGVFVDEARTFRGFEFTADEFWGWSIAKWPVRLAGSVTGMAWLPPHMQVYYLPPWSNAADAMKSSLVV